jgi:hypothetical protein
VSHASGRLRKSDLEVWKSNITKYFTEEPKLSATEEGRPKAVLTQGQQVEVASIITLPCKGKMLEDTYYKCQKQKSVSRLVSTEEKKIGLQLYELNSVTYMQCTQSSEDRNSHPHSRTDNLGWSGVQW